MMIGGDNWHVEETYGAIKLMRRLIGEVLEEKVAAGYFGRRGRDAAGAEDPARQCNPLLRARVIDGRHQGPWHRRRRDRGGGRTDGHAEASVAIQPPTSERPSRTERGFTEPCRLPSHCGRKAVDPVAETADLRAAGAKKAGARAGLPQFGETLLALPHSLQCRLTAGGIVIFVVRVSSTLHRP